MKLFIVLALVAFAYGQEDLGGGDLGGGDLGGGDLGGGDLGGGDLGGGDLGGGDLGIGGDGIAPTKSTGSQIGKEILGGIGDGVKDIIGSITDEMDKDQSKWIKDALAGASNSGTLLEILDMIKTGELVVPSKKRAINLPSKEELLAKLKDMYENVKQTLEEHTATAQELFEQALARLKDAYAKVLENEKVKDIQGKIQEAMDKLVAKAKEIAGSHEVASRALRANLHKRLVEHLEAHLSAEMSQRAARSIGSKVDEAIARLEARLQWVADKFEGKVADVKEKYINPIVAKLEELKNNPKVQEKLQGIRDLFADVRNLFRQLVSGETSKRSIGSAIDEGIANLEAKLGDLLSKVDDKAGELKEKYVDPLLAKLEEVKNTPALMDKFDRLRTLYQEVNDLARQLIFGESA